MDSLRPNKDWSHSSIKDFWGEIAPYDHVVQIYENDSVFLNLLSGFVSEGINSGDGVVVIATASHLELLDAKLSAAGYDLKYLSLINSYIPLEAECALSKFMINDWPDESRFMDFVTTLMMKAKAEGRHVRAFGEMVAILWAKGLVGATVRLEHLWNRFCEQQSFCLFCAYPQSGFTQDGSESVMHLCDAHTRMIAGVDQSKTEVFYKKIDKQVG
jgi:hypothetical protein